MLSFILVFELLLELLVECYGINGRRIDNLISKLRIANLEQREIERERARARERERKSEEERESERERERERERDLEERERKRRGEEVNGRAGEGEKEIGLCCEQQFEFELLARKNVRSCFDSVWAERKSGARA